MFFQKVLLIVVYFFGTVVFAGVDRMQLDELPDVPGEFQQTLKVIQKEGLSCPLKLMMNHQWVFVGEEAVSKLSDSMLSVVYQMHQQLKFDRSFRHHIAGLVELDLQDVNHPLVIPSEFGGVGFFYDGSFEMLPILSGGRYSLNSYTDRFGSSVTVFAHQNSTYRMPEWARHQIPYVFLFHLHATGMTPLFCSPSFGVGPYEGGFSGDIAYAIHLIKKQGLSHHFVISKQEGRSYSVVYFGGEKTTDDEWFVSVIGLPTIDY